MRRISTPTAAQDLFGPGKHGFRNGDPANAILATRLQAEWFNALQEEVATAVEQSGAALNPANSGQLSVAIEGVVDRKAPVATRVEAEESVEANANNTKRMTPLRVLQAIKKNLVGATEIIAGMLRVGTQGEVDAGSLDSVAVTPKKLFNGALIVSSTYMALKLPSWLGGWILQRGSVSVGVEGGAHSVSVTLPLAYTTSYSLNTMFWYTGARVENANFAQPRDKTLTGFSVDNQWVGSGSNLAGTIDFITLGK